jgi:hypothetical protein
MLKWISRRGLKLPGAESVRSFYLSLAACSVALTITVALRLALGRQNADGIVWEDSMENKAVHRKVARSSFLSIIGDIGTAAIGGLLAT